MNPNMLTAKMMSFIPVAGMATTIPIVMSEMNNGLNSPKRVAR